MPSHLPVLPLKSTVVFPRIFIPLSVGRKKSLELTDCLIAKADEYGFVVNSPREAHKRGVARFLAVRPTHPTSVDQLELDCTNSQGNATTYSVDLRSEDTFVERPFEPSRRSLGLP